MKAVKGNKSMLWKEYKVVACMGDSGRVVDDRVRTHVWEVVLEGKVL